VNRISTTTLLVVVTLTGSAILSSPFAGAEQASPIPRIGVLARDTPISDGLREGLRELGYTEGKDIVFEWRQHVGTNEEAASVVAEFLQLRVDLIVTSGTPAALAALQATTTVPVVFAGAGDPVYSGLALSLAQPGRNGTGVSVVSTELYPKRLEYLHWIAPRARRIAFLENPSNPTAPRQREETQRAAQKFGLQLELFDARGSQELDEALKAIRASKPDAIFVSGDTTWLSARAKITQAVRDTKRPAVFCYPEYHEYGVLISYGPSLREVGRRAARYVDRILKGAKPSELPIEQISTYKLIIDLRVAKSLGLKVPQDLLLRADEVIR
jgi:putative ABC transport system substrate-binding protein